MEDLHISIVDYYSRQRRGHCGYCGSKAGSLVYGLHAEMLTVEDYQNMIDRGWRRSGKYCYKSIMDKTCCPFYTIRCAANDFKVSKSQKKILKKFNEFLITGKIPKDRIYKETEIGNPMEANHLWDEKKQNDIKMEAIDVSNSFSANNINETSQKEKVHPTEINTPKSDDKNNETKSTKDKSQKAKFLRIERKIQKLQKLGLSKEEIDQKLIEKKKYPIVKNLEDYIFETSEKSQLHNLKICLVRSNTPSEEFNKTFSVEYDLYKKYQISIHKDPPEKITEHQFEKFLVLSPLQYSNHYGSYHQQYWLDDKLLAVGVIDILPKCVSSVYFFYDPDFSQLSLGSYGALREIEFTRNLSKNLPDLNFYYMGFYIHSCIKMKYKAAFKPSFLLCPEVYTWHPINDCLPKLHWTKYSRFNEDNLAVDTNSVVSFSDVLILYNNTAMSLEYYLNQKKCSQSEIQEIIEYAKLVGKLCSRKMLLYRN